MTWVEVTTGSRLHFGLLCGPPSSNWHYGGIGMMIDAPSWKLRASFCDSSDDEIVASPATVQRLTGLLTHFRETVAKVPVVRIDALSETSFHSGLGSGTQLTLAAGTALLLLTGKPRPRSISSLAESLGRSQRSAIGTFGFDYGGFIVDHGRSSGDRAARMDRIAYPEQWRMVVVTPISSEGLSGDSEEEFFGERKYLDQQAVERCDDLIRRKIVVAIQHGDFFEFRAALREYGTLVGQYYAPAQGGVFSSPVIRELLSRLAERGIDGAVQSSWGPSVCIPASSQGESERIVEQIYECAPETDVSVHIAKCLSTGATVRTAAPENQRTFL